jgi:transposase InsO family protein
MTLPRVVRWRASASPRTDRVLDALEQAIYDRCDDDTAGPVHHSDRGTPCLFVRYTEPLAEAVYYRQRTGLVGVT